jgi:serine protease Do
MATLRERLETGRVRLFLLGFVFASALWAVFLACKGGSKTAPPAAATAAPPPAAARASGGGNSAVSAEGFGAMLAKVRPAVVNISATKVARARPSSPFSNDPFFRFFFGEPMVPRERRERSLGSGVIVQADGVILTNNHVIRDADEILVALADKRELRAKVAGTDPKTDIAVLRVDGKDLPTLPIGDSRSVRVGDLAFAVGSPFGLAQTATFGIISAVGRGELRIVDYEDFIQTDAAINPGNSGGALVNSRGELIGINTAILSRGAQGNQGIGFAVPAHMAKAVMDSILTRGKVVRGYLGVQIQEITTALAKAMGLTTTNGALVAHVQEGSPAAKAGLRGRDVIVAVDGQQVDDYHRVRLRIASTPPGTTVRLTVLRGGRALEVPVTLGELPEEAGARVGGPAGGGALQGLELQNLTPRLADQLNLPPGTRGVVVVGIRHDAKAAQAGLRRGDVIFEVNRVRVRSVSEMRQVLAQTGGGSVLLLVGRGDVTFYVVIEP